MDLELIVLSEISQSEKDKYHRMSLIRGIYEQNKQNRNGGMDTWNKLTPVRGERQGGC